MVDSEHGDYLKSNLAAIRNLDVPGLERLTPAEARKRFPYMCFCEGDDMLYESKGAGVVNPRRFVVALQTAAHLEGCDIVREAVSDVATLTTHPGGATVMRVTTERGHTYYARKVLLATGAFTEFSDLLPRGVKPNWELVTHTVILAEISEKDLLKMR